MVYHQDPQYMPDTGESPAERWARCHPLDGSAGQGYVAKRGVPGPVAEAAQVRFDADFCGRPAVVAPLLDCNGSLTALHGRYLHTIRGQNKMLTVGAGGGQITVLEGCHGTPLILVEGLFDALSLAACDLSCAATIGRWAPWWPRVTADRTVWLGFDAGRPGEAECACYAARLTAARVRRLPPPPRCKDWNTALVKRGAEHIRTWVAQVINSRGASIHE